MPRMMLGEHWDDPKTFFEGQQGAPKKHINILKSYAN
jgi:hypothetical protein